MVKDDKKEYNNYDKKMTPFLPKMIPKLAGDFEENIVKTI